MMEIISQNIFMEVPLCSIISANSGCIHNEEDIYEIYNSISTQFQIDSTVLPAPNQRFLHSNSSEIFQFQYHNMTVSYLTKFPHLVEANIDMDTESTGIKRSTTCSGNHGGYYTTKNIIDCSMEPVVRRYNEADHTGHPE